MTTLERLCAAIETEEGRGEEVDTLANALLAEWGEPGIADRVMNEASEELEGRVLADVLSVLIWSTSDNGHGITRAAESWLRQGEDGRKAYVALYLDVYPFVDREEREQVLTAIGAEFPQLAERCRKILADSARR